MRFWDSSALVSLLVGETQTRRLLALLEADPVVLAWWGTPQECVSALSRLERDGHLDRAGVNGAIARLRALQNVWHEIGPTEAVRESALRLLRVHPLRAADSLQLAAALVASEVQTSGLPFVCLDERLIEAASREGLPLLPG